MISGVTEAYFHLGKIIGQGTPGTAPNCKQALKYIKKWVERTGWHDTHLVQAEEHFLKEEYDLAFRDYLIAAEMGIEVAQINAAYLLDKELIDFGKLEYNGTEGDLNRFDLALPLYLRAANQGNVDARVRVGGKLYSDKIDLYYYGFSNKAEKTSLDYTWTIAMLPHTIAEYWTNLSTRPNFEVAFMHYSAAAEGEFSHSSVAMFNLGWMYEHGLGVPMDFYLAKRWYELALVTNPGAYLPVQIAVGYLYLKWVVTDFVSLATGSQIPVTVEKKPEPIPGEDQVEKSPKNDNILLMVLLGALTVLMYLRRQLV